MHPNPTPPLKLISDTVASHKAKGSADTLYVRPIYGTGPVDDGVHVRYAIVDDSETYVTCDSLAEADALLAAARNQRKHRNGPIARAVMKNINTLQGVDGGEMWVRELPINSQAYKAHRKNIHRTHDVKEYFSTWAALRASVSGGHIEGAIADTNQLIRAEATES